MDWKSHAADAQETAVNALRGSDEHHRRVGANQGGGRIPADRRQLQ